MAQKKEIEKKVKTLGPHGHKGLRSFHTRRWLPAKTQSIYAQKYSRIKPVVRQVLRTFPL